MAFSLTSRVNTGNGTSSSTTLTSPSFTPTANSRLFVFVSGERDGHVTDYAWSITDSLTSSWTLLDISGTFNWNGDQNYAISVVCWYTDIGASPSSMTVTVDPLPLANVAFMHMAAFDVTGYDTGTPFAQASVDDGAQLGGGDSETDSIALGSAPTSGNLVVAMSGVGADVTGATSTPTGYTALINPTANYTHASVYYHTSTTTATVTFSDFGQSVGNWGGIIFEMTLASGGATNLTVQDAFVTTQVDAATLTKSDTLAVADASVTTQVDNVVLTLGAQTLTVQNAFVTTQVDSPTLTKTDTLTVNDAFVTTQADNAVLQIGAVTLTVQSAFVTTQTDNVTLTKSDTLAVQDTFVTTQTDNAALTKSDTLTVVDAFVTTQADNATLTKSDTLTVVDAFVTTQADNVTLTKSDNLTVQDSFITTQTDALDLTYILHYNPDSDTLVGNWTNEVGATSNLYQSVDERITANDSDYIQSDVSPSSSPVVVALPASISDPLTSGNHVLAYRYALDGSGTINLVVELRQGYVNEGSQGTLIAQWTHNSIGSIATAEQTLSGAQADAITNYASLFVRMVASEV